MNYLGWNSSVDGNLFYLGWLYSQIIIDPTKDDRFILLPILCKILEDVSGEV